MKYYYNLGCSFMYAAEKYIDHQALCYDEKKYYYSDVLSWVERLAKLLLQEQVKRGHVVAIANTKKPLSYALMLAAIRLGIAYVNIDIAAPIARNLQVLDVCKPTLLFYDDCEAKEYMLDIANKSLIKLISVESDSVLPTVNSDDMQLQNILMHEVDGSCIAYIMFTSGSTGIPKGVAVTHQNVLHFISWGKSCFNITGNDNFANLSPMYFDNSVFDFYVALFSGARLSPISRELLNKPYELIEYVSKLKCTIWFSVPSLLIYLMSMKSFSSGDKLSLRCIIFGGEGYPKVELNKLYRIFNNSSRLINVYGPTECTCICSAYEISDNDFNDLEGFPPLGRLNPNFDYKVINEYGQDSDYGELCLIGPNVAAGYFNDCERSSTAFISLTESNRFMKRMYKTGDVVRMKDGDLHFVGRKDNQIKHMGYRIELEEIECALVKLPQVTQAAVMYNRLHTTHGKIIAFVSCVEQADEGSLFDGLSKLLPSYMIPSRILINQYLPKNANGKVDKHKLLELL